MWYLTKVADWWDQQRKESELVLDQFVERNPNQFGFIVATALHTSMVVASGTVDVLRLGDGIAQGGFKGAGKDALRLLGIVGPLGKGLQMVNSAKKITISQVILDVAGGRCAWVASTRALAATGQKIGGRIFARVQDLVGATGISWPSTMNGVASLTVLSNTLRSIGAQLGAVKTVTNVRQLGWLLPRDGSVAIIAVRLLRSGKVVGGHALVAFYNNYGKMKFLDRDGKVYDSLQQVGVSNYAAEFVLTHMVQVKNVCAKLAGPKGMTTLAMEVLGVAVTDQKK